MDEVDVRRMVVDQDFGMHIMEAAQISLVAIGKQYFKLWTKEKERKEADTEGTAPDNNLLFSGRAIILCVEVRYFAQLLCWYL